MSVTVLGGHFFQDTVLQVAEELKVHRVINRTPKINMTFMKSQHLLIIFGRDRMCLLCGWSDDMELIVG